MACCGLTIALSASTCDEAGTEGGSSACFPGRVEVSANEVQTAGFSRRQVLMRQPMRRAAPMALAARPASVYAPLVGRHLSVGRALVGSMADRYRATSVQGHQSYRKSEWAVINSRSALYQFPIDVPQGLR